MGWNYDPDGIHSHKSGEIAALAEKTTPVDDDLLVIEDSADSNAKKKVKLSNLGGGAKTLDDLSDVDTSGVSDGDALVYDSGSSKWVPGAGGGGAAYSATVGDTSTTEFNIEHDLDTSAVVVGVVEVTSGDALVHGTDFTWEVVDSDEVKVTFAVAPGNDDALIVVLASGGTSGGGGGGGSESFDDVMSDLAGDLVHAWKMDVASGDVPDLIGSLDLVSTGTGSPFIYQVASPFGPASAMEVPPGAGRYLLTSGLGSIPTGGADRTFVCFAKAPMGTNSRLYGYGTNANQQHFSCRPRQGSSGVQFHHWGHDISIPDLQRSDEWTMYVHGVYDSSFIAFVAGRWLGRETPLNTYSGNPLRVFDSNVESSNAAGLTIARLYVFDTWLGRSNVYRLWDAWKALGGG